MRLVLDTNVVLSALLWEGNPLRLLEAAHAGRVELVSSPPLLAELTDMLGRSKFSKKVTASLLTIDQIVDRYADLATLVWPYVIPPTAADPNDDVVLGTALAARADWIVSGDAHLLALQIFREVSILTARAAVERLSSLTYQRH